MLYLVAGCLAAAGGLLGLWLEKIISVISTSFIGAYLLNWFIGIWAGGFPNVLTLSQYLQSKDYSFPYVFYAYFASILILWGLGAYVQKRQLVGKGDHKEDKQPLLGKY